MERMHSQSGSKKQTRHELSAAGALRAMRDRFPKPEEDIFVNDGSCGSPEEIDHSYSVRPPPDRRRIIRIPTETHPLRTDALPVATRLAGDSVAGAPYRVVQTARYWVFEYTLRNV